MPTPSVLGRLSSLGAEGALPGSTRRSGPDESLLDGALWWRNASGLRSSDFYLRPALRLLPADAVSPWADSRRRVHRQFARARRSVRAAPR